MVVIIFIRFNSCWFVNVNKNTPFHFQFCCGDRSPMIVIIRVYSYIRFNSCWFINFNKSYSLNFQLCYWDCSPMVVAAQLLWFDPVVQKELGLSGINPQSTRK